MDVNSFASRFNGFRDDAGRSLPPLLLHQMAQLPFHRFESVMNDFGQRGMRTVIHLLFIGDELVARRHRDIDAHPELVPLVMRMIGLLDSHVTPVDVIAEFFEPSRFFKNELVDRLRFIDPAIGNVNWPLHNRIGW